MCLPGLGINSAHLFGCAHSGRLLGGFLDDLKRPRVGRRKRPSTSIPPKIHKTQLLDVRRRHRILPWERAVWGRWGVLLQNPHMRHLPRQCLAHTHDQQKRYYCLLWQHVSSGASTEAAAAILSPLLLMLGVLYMLVHSLHHGIALSGSAWCWVGCTSSSKWRMAGSPGL